MKFPLRWLKSLLRWRTQVPIVCSFTDELQFTPKLLHHKLTVHCHLGVSCSLCPSPVFQHFSLFFWSGVCAELTRDDLRRSMYSGDFLFLKQSTCDDSSSCCCGVWRVGILGCHRLKRVCLNPVCFCTLWELTGRHTVY